MRRRAAIGLLGALALAPNTARAQSGQPAVGYLGSETPQLFSTRLAAFKAGLTSAGFDDGRNVVIEYRWAEGNNERLPALAAELVARNVAVLAAPGSVASALAAKSATTTIPVVFEIGANPLTVGLVGSLNRPGGNVTGVTSLNAEVGPKRLELLRALVPSARTIGLLVNPTNPRNAEATTRDIAAATESLGLVLHVVSASREEDFDTAFRTMAEKRVEALVIANETFFANRNQLLAALTLKHSLPAAHQSREFALAGGLMCYGGVVAESHRQAGFYVGRVLKGEKPADLPVQQVTKVEFVLNVRTAKLLGLAIPLHLLSRADEVIE